MKWILAQEKAPTKQDADENGLVETAFWSNAKGEYYRGEAVWYTIKKSELDHKTMWHQRIPLPNNKP